MGFGVNESWFFKFYFDRFFCLKRQDTIFSVFAGRYKRIFSPKSASSLPYFENISFIVDLSEQENGHRFAKSFCLWQD